MLVIKVELWPGGDKERAKEIGRLGLGNISSHSEEATYAAVMLEEGVQKPKRALLKDFKRKQGFWTLIKTILTLDFKDDAPDGMLRHFKDIEHVLPGETNS